jgi:HEAT repeat protein
MQKRFKIFSEKNPAIRRRLVLTTTSKKLVDSLELLSEIIKNDPSPVIRHEAAFVLGTIKSSKSLEILMSVAMSDSSDLVKHEAIEAIGDLGIQNKKVKDFLKKFVKDKNPFIKDTAEIALETLKLK